MSDVVAQLPAIIERAAASPLGVLALMVVALALLGFFFFREASERTRLATFAALFAGVVMFGFAVVGDSGPADAEGIRQGAPETPAVASGQPSAPAPPSAPPLPVTRSFSVRKGAGGAPLNTKLIVNPGDQLTITGRGEIWSGVLATGRNGPRGWHDAVLPGDRVAPASFPLPGAPPYSLIAGFDNDRWLLVGDSLSTKYSGRTATLWLSINDAVQGRGDGLFDVQVRLQRRP